MAPALESEAEDGLGDSEARVTPAGELDHIPG